MKACSERISNKFPNVAATADIVDFGICGCALTCNGKEMLDERLHAPPKVGFTMSKTCIRVLSMKIHQLF